MNKVFLRNAVLYSLIMAGIFIFYDLIVYLLGIDKFSPMTYLLLIALVVAIYITVFIVSGRHYRNKYSEGYITYGKAFVMCLIIAVLSTLILALYTYLFNKFFDPEQVMENAMKVIEMIEDNANIPEANKEEILTRVMNNATAEKVTLQALANNSIFSVIFGAISALFIRKKQKAADMVY